MYYMLCPTAAKRTELIETLAAQGIQSVFHYLPLHQSKMGRHWGYKDGDLPVTEHVSERLIRLPFYCGLGNEEQGQIIRAVLDAIREW